MNLHNQLLHLPKTYETVWKYDAVHKRKNVLNPITLYFKPYIINNIKQNINGLQKYNLILFSFLIFVTTYCLLQANII